MLSKINPIQRDQLELVALEQFVPNDHLVHKIKAALDFSFIYELVKEVYIKCKETIERVFADAKEKHGMRWTTLRGIQKLSMQAMPALNLKKMANWTWRGPKIA